MRLLLTFLVLSFLFPSFASAQSYGETYEQLRELNVGNPANGGRFERTEQILKRKIQDRKSKVVGNLKDISLTSSGYVEALEVQFDRMSKTGSLTLNFADTGFKAAPNTYIMAQHSQDEIEELYVSLLANIQTAAGAEDVYSVKNLKGAILRAENGRALAKIEDILFDNSGDRARALYVKMTEVERGKMIAVPFAIGNIQGRNITVSNEQAKAITDFLKAK